MCKELFKGIKDTICFDSLWAVGRKHKHMNI